MIEGFRQWCSLVMFVALTQFSYARNISPLEYGLRSARTGVERYEVLLKTHQEAVERGYGVTYEGIERIDIEIPESAKTIPLSYYTDFAGVELSVLNKEKRITLFSLSNKIEPIDINQSCIRTGRFFNNKTLRKGKKLLIVVDETPWVKQRRGYKYGVTRKDVILVNKGRAVNKVIALYSTPESKPKCYYCDVTGQEAIIKGLVFSRSKNSDHITQFVSINNLNNVFIKDIVINTPEGTGLSGESALIIENSTNVSLENVTINGTYSLKDKYGYGIEMNNVWNSRFYNLKATCNWGVFGNNNVSYATLENCDINRFDIHCYGKDVFCKKTVFRDLYNQYSSFYGTLRYENCRFISFVPVLFESSYSAYTYFKLEIENCSIDVDVKRPYLINAGNPSLLAEDSRQELASARWPDISIKNSIVNIPEGTKYWTIFQATGNDNTLIEGLSSISVEGLEIRGQRTTPLVRLSNRKVRLKNKLEKRIRNSNIQTIE